MRIWLQELVRHHFVPTFFRGPAPRSQAPRRVWIAALGHMARARPQAFRTVPSPRLPRVVGSAVEKLRPVTSGHASGTPGSSPPCVREQRPGGAAASVGLRPSPAGCAATGAPGLPGAPPPAPRIPGPGGERGGRPARAAGCARALGAPRAGGGAWPGRRRAPSHWPFVLQLCPTLGAAPPPRPPRAVAPGKFASPGRAGPGGGLRAPPLGSGNSAARGSLAVASPKKGDSARAIRERPGPVSAPRPPAGGRPGSGRRRASPGPWPSDKGVLEVVAEAHFIFPQEALAMGRREARHAFVSPAGRGVCLRGSWRARGVCRGGSLGP